MSASLDEFAERKLAALEQRNLRRTLIETERLGPVEVKRRGKRLISFSCNDYLNLSQHQAIKAAAVEATEKYGVGAGASRLVTGNHPLFAELEAKLAKLKGAEAACVFGSGYLANTGIIPALAGVDDMVVVDKLSHACIFAGAKLTGGALHVFRHNDTGHLGEILAAHRADHPRALIVTDGVFSMDGDLAPLGELSALAQGADVPLMVDDAHGFGVLGEDGRGAVSALGTPQPAIYVATLGKAAGCAGAFVAGSEALIEFLIQRARTWVFSTAPPPALAAAGLAALKILSQEPEHRQRLHQTINYLREGARQRGLSLGGAPGIEDSSLRTPIQPLLIGEASRAMAVSARLMERGYWVAAIRPPTVPAGTSRLRITLSAAHTREQIDGLLDALVVALAEAEPA